MPKKTGLDSESGSELDDGGEEKKMNEYDMWNVRCELENNILFKTADNTMRHGEIRVHRCPGIITGTFRLVYECILSVGIAGLNDRRFYAKSSNHTKSEYTQPSTDILVS